MGRDIQGSGYVARSLQAAVSAVSRSTDFHFAVLLAANLGQDADTTATIIGQLAGAVFGVSSIPSAWLDGLIGCERPINIPEQPFGAGWSR